MDYRKTMLKTQIHIDGVYSVHYFEYTKDFSYSGEMHNIYLEQLLIFLIRGNRRAPSSRKPVNNSLLISICEYMEQQVGQDLHFSEIQSHFNVSASVIKNTFREHMGCGVMEYFNRLKIDAAKEMIREGAFTFTEISERLSFNTPQYFTTVFRRVSGMTPSEYAGSVRSNSGDVNVGEKRHE